MKSRLLIFIFLCWNLIAQSQGLNNNWLLGYLPTALDSATTGKAIINFNSGNPVVNASTFKNVFDKTQGNISDANGNLLMSSNGIFIANALGDTMQNGGGLNPDPYVLANYTQVGLAIPNGNIILPMPGDSTRYVLFHQSIINTPICCNGILYYSIIDMSLGNGLGGVSIKNVLLPLPKLSGGVAACKHANGRDWWVLLAQDTSNVMWKILLTPQGITSITSQSFPTNLTFFGSESQACFSPDGSKFAFTTLRGFSWPKWTNFIRLFNFNRCTGILSERTDILIPDTLICRGLCFSPNSNYLYACSNKVIYQINLNSTNVAASIDTVAVYDGFSPGGYSSEFELMYLAKDEKIYISTKSGTLRLHTIFQPDSTGVVCDVRQHSLFTSCYNIGSVPNHPNYFLGAELGSVCDTLLDLKHTDIKETYDFNLAPNPTKNETTIYFDFKQYESYQIDIVNSKGILMERKKIRFTGKLYSLDTSTLDNGIYFVKLISTDKSSRLQKLVIVK